MAEARTLYRTDRRVRTDDPVEAFAGKTYDDLDSASLAHLLRVGFIPFPRTIYKGVSALGPGDTLGAGQIRTDPIYSLSRSTQSETPDTARLLLTLVQAVEAAWRPGRPLVLFQSAGKDSTALALALSRSGIPKADILCVTFYNGVENDEHHLAAQYAAKLGLKHASLRAAADDPGLTDAFERYFERSPYPNVDQSLGPYLQICAQLDKGAVVLDGTGPDIYFGLTAPRWLFLLDRLGYGGSATDWLAGKLFSRRFLPRRLVMNRAEANLGAYSLSEAEIAMLLPKCERDEAAWRRISAETRRMSLMDFRANVKSRNQSFRQIMEKASAAAMTYGHEARFPFADEEVSDYVFNLPERERFGGPHGPSKVILRRLLAETLDYDAAAIGKRPFLFDAAGFLKLRREWVKAQILDCPYWDDVPRARLGDMVDRIYGELGRRGYRSKNALLGLMQLSGWITARKSAASE